MLKKITILIQIMTVFFRGKRPLVVFEMKSMGLSEHVYPIIDWLLKKTNFLIVIIVPDKEWDISQEEKKSKSFPPRLFYFCNYHFKKFKSGPNVIVSMHPESGSKIAKHLFSKRTIRVVMQHGLSDKLVFLDKFHKDPLSNFDVVFLIGPIFKEGSLKKYCTKYPKTCSRLNFIEVGSPKTDVLFNATVSRREMLHELGLDANKPIVCYAPTWEKWASLEKNGLEIMEALGSLDVNVIVKLHHVSLSNLNYDWIIRDGHGGKDWRKIIAQLEIRFPNLKLAQEQDATPYLIISDLLISDASGVAYEFVLQDKPVIFFDVPELFEIYGKEGIHYWGRECGDIVNNSNSLKQAVIENLANPQKNRILRSKWISKIVYFPGEAAQRAGEAIIQLVDKSRKIQH